MIVPDPKKYSHSDENLLPMINIVFLLLIFFMVAGTLAASDALQLTPPTSTRGTSTELEDSVLLVSASGDIRYADIAMNLAQPEAEIVERFERELKVKFGEDGLDDLPLISVKADAEVTSAQLFTIMRILEQAGIASIQLLATER